MSPRDSPDHMKGLPSAIVFEDQHARPLRKIRVVFHHHGAGQSVDNVRNRHLVRRKFIVAVSRHTHLAAPHQCPYLFQRLAQPLDPFTFLIVFLPCLPSPANVGHQPRR